MAKKKAPEQSPESLQLASLQDQRYGYGKSYLKQAGYLINWPTYERFKAGDQWPPATARTKSLPRPVFNIIRYIQNHKVSTVMNENIKMLFSPLETVKGLEPDTEQDIIDMQRSQDAGEKFTRYAETTWEEINQDELNEEALESASNLGTGIWHYYWDKDQVGGKFQPWIGKMCGESLDPINVFFGNPQSRRVQKQPWIVISSREQLSTVRDEARANGLSEILVQEIKPDKEVQDEGYDRAKIEVDGSEKVTLLTMYWKEQGRVFFASAAAGKPVKPKTNTGFKLYPLEVMQWERRKKSIHGIGDTESLIANQKSINLLMAMQMMSVQLTGWPKALVNPAFVDPNTLNNDPGQPIIDNSPAGQDGVKYLTPGPISGLAANLVESFMEHTRTLSSAQDASTGDVGGSQLNASAIMLLQKAAGVPIESIKKRFYRAMEGIGRIWEEFYKVKYNTTRLVTLKDENGDEYADYFNGSDYADVDLHLKIDIGPSSQYSEQLMMSTLDKLFDKGAITTEMYLENAPSTVVPFRDKLIKQLQEKQSQDAAMQQQMMQQQAAMQQQQPVGPDPQQQFQEQQALKQQDHQNAVELERVKGEQRIKEKEVQVKAAKDRGGKGR
jgi:hypothetical protein